MSLIKKKIKALWRSERQDLLGFESIELKEEM